jgi:hypothetical protein
MNGKLPISQVSKRKTNYIATGLLSKVIKVSGIDLTTKSKIRLEVRTESGHKLLGYLHIGTISYWKNTTKAAPKRIEWEKFKRWVENSK